MSSVSINLPIVMTDHVNHIKIAYFMNSFPKLSETFILNEIIQLRKTGVHVRVLSLAKGMEEVVHPGAKQIESDVWFLSDLGKTEKLQNILRIFLAHPLRLLKTIWFIFQHFARNRSWILKQTFYLAGEVEKSGVRHIHAHFALDAAEKTMLVSMMTGIPYSMHPHAWDIYGRQDLLKQKIKFAKFVSTECAYSKNHLSRYYPAYPPEKISVIRLGIDLEMFARHMETTKPSQKGQDVLRIASVSRLMEKKGLIYLLEAVKRLNDEGCKVKAEIVGDGPQYPVLKSFIDENHLENAVVMAGAQTSDYVKKLLAGSDLFVLPCIVAQNGDRDATPTALLESMAMGLPVISTRVAGIPEIIPQGGGLVVPPNDTDALVSAVEQVAKMGTGERIAMGVIGRRFVQQHCNIRLETAKLLDLIMHE